jgi:hypothetical protein
MRSQCAVLSHLASVTEIARACIKSPPLVPIPAHRARLPFCGLFTAGKIKVVVASRMKELLATGPVEKALLNL